ncbi:MAG TPA: hypothetical protein VFS55_08870 [Dokdonella sp.]|nr:hypothetical protein [Dokdonella sp.]
MNTVFGNCFARGAAWLFVASAGVPVDAAAANPASAGVDFWIGCYRLVFGDDASKTRVVRLTGTPVPARPGSYAIESVPASDADFASAWRPVSTTSIRIGIDNGRSGWSAELKAVEGVFVGSSSWVDEDGRSGAGYVVTATSVDCAAATSGTARLQPDS